MFAVNSYRIVEELDVGCEKKKKKKAVMIPILGLSNRKERVGFNKEEEYKRSKVLFIPSKDWR